MTPQMRLDAGLATVDRKGLPGEEVGSVQSEVGDDVRQLGRLTHAAGGDAPKNLGKGAVVIPEVGIDVRRDVPRSRQR